MSGPTPGHARLPDGILSPEESLILAIHPSRRFFLVRAAVASILLLALAGVLPMLFAASPLFLLLGLLLAALTWLPPLQRKFSVFVLTDQRLIKRAGVFRPRTRYAPLTKVEDLMVSQDLSQKLLGCGDVRIAAAGTGEYDMLWNSVDDPCGLVELIRRQIGPRNASP